MSPKKLQGVSEDARQIELCVLEGNKSPSHCFMINRRVPPSILQLFECAFVSFPPLSLIHPPPHPPVVECTTQPCLCLHRCDGNVLGPVEKRTEDTSIQGSGRINFPSKELTQSRVKRGDLWGGHVLMSFLTLQMMLYRQEPRGNSGPNYIDSSLMAANNDISLDPGEEWN